MGFTAGQREIVEAVMREKGTPGVSAAIVKDGEIVADGGVGYRNLEDQFPMTAGTVSPICSLTKSITCVALMQLAEAGLLWLDEPVVSYLPEFRVADPEASRTITTRMLLSHKSGMGRTGHQNAMFDAEHPNPYRDRADLVARLADVQLQTPPNASYSYCNEGYVTASLLLERLTGQTLEGYEEEHVFGPLGLANTFPRFSQWRASQDRITNYLKKDDGYQTGYLPEDYGIYLASGSVCSTAHDLAVYLIASMNYVDSPLLSGGGLDQMQAVSNPYGDTGWGYGFGWEIQWTPDGRKVAAHSGGLSGVNTYQLIVPSERLGVVVLTNLSGGGPGEIAEALAGDVLGAPLFRDNLADPLPIRTRYPSPEAAKLAEYAGEYRYDHGDDDQGTLRFRAEDGGLLVQYSGDDAETSPTLPIGPDLFMDLRYGEPFNFRRGADGEVAGVLSGGDRYSRVSPG
jgi:CubicO group peptidase (beta-lactamase class C family)